MHEPPFVHGALSHSSTSDSHKEPAKPSEHTQAKKVGETSCVHNPPFRHGKLAHSLTSVSHQTPANPSGHVQLA